MLLEELTFEHFEELVNTELRIVSGTAEITALLAEVIRLPQAKAGVREPFSLTLIGPGNVALIQGIYQVDAGKLGVLEIFLVTNGPDPTGRGMRHEAVFA